MKFLSKIQVKYAVVASKDDDFIKTAYDYLGSAIRDNTREEKIQLGKDIEEYGVDNEGSINYPKGHPDSKH